VGFPNSRPVFDERQLLTVDDISNVTCSAIHDVELEYVCVCGGGVEGVCSWHSCVLCKKKTTAGIHSFFFQQKPSFLGNHNCWRMTNKNFRLAVNGRRDREANYAGAPTDLVTCVALWVSLMRKTKYFDE
jgi:hypothetical protein